VAERTGLSQDVLRVWERRYGAVKPERGPGGQRFYTNADVERLRLLHSAAKAGRSIGQIAGLSEKALARMVSEDAEARERRASLSTGSVDAAGLVETAFALTRSLAASELDDHLRRAAALLGMSAFVERIMAPLLRQVGDAWHEGRLATSHEHLASSILHDILVETMRGFPHGNGAPRVLVATPAGERHAIGAALVGASAAIAGWNVVYLGTDLPAKDIAAAAVTADVRIVALSIVYVDDRKRVLGELRSLRALLPTGIAIMVGGAGTARLDPELAASGVQIASIEALAAALRTDDR